MKIHIVKEGDTLYKLAQKYGVEVEDIIACNPLIANPDELIVGLKVKIPTQPTKVKLVSEQQDGQAQDLFYQHYVPAEQVSSFYDFPDLSEMSGMDSPNTPTISSHFHELYLPSLKWEYPGGSEDGRDAEPSTTEKISVKKRRQPSKKARSPRARSQQVQVSKPKKSTPLIKY